jgi:hypothetical protein
LALSNKKLRSLRKELRVVEEKESTEITSHKNHLGLHNHAELKGSKSTISRDVENSLLRLN